MKIIAVALALLVSSTFALAGAWGEGNFENDDAMDWAGACAKSTSAAFVRAAFEPALTGAMLEAREAAIAVAAAEVVAAALGKPGPDLPPELKTWIERRPPGELAGLAPTARKALARVRDPSVSELHQLWSQGKPNGWALAIAYLEARLGK
jgi:poly-gamma-glutamate capsule biosynthesis protein CapA/YwtB (metallophosphatase superfamily)